MALTPEQQAQRNTQLLIAASHGTLNDVNKALKSGADINAVDSGGNTALHHAINKNKTDILKYLLQQSGVKVNQKNSMPCEANLANGLQTIVEANDTPLHLAIALGRSTCVKALLTAKKLDINTRNSPYGQTVLHTVAESKEEESATIFSLLLDKAGHLLNTKDDKDGWTPLMTAVFYQNTKVFDALLRQDSVRVDRTDSNGITALHIATQNSNTYMMGKLLTRGAILSATNKWGLTPLHEAINPNNCTALSALLQHPNIQESLNKHIDLPDTDGRTALHRAAKFGNPKAIRLLLSKGANPTIMSKHQETAVSVLEEAISGAPDRDKKELTKVLDELKVAEKEKATAKVPKDAKGGDGKKKVGNGAGGGKKNEGAKGGDGKKKVGNGAGGGKNNEPARAPKGAKGGDGKKAVATPKTPPTKKVGEFEWSADRIKHTNHPDKTDKYGYTALHWTVLFGKPSDIEEALKKGASVNCVDNGGRTALHAAAFMGKTNAISTLLKAGADTTIQDNFG